MEHPVYSAIVLYLGLVLVAVAIVLVGAGAFFKSRDSWRGPVLEYWGATAFLEALLVLLLYVDFWVPSLVLHWAVIVVAVPWIAWRRRKPLRQATAPPAVQASGRGLSN